MSNQIHNFFQGSLMVSESYLGALIPMYFQAVTSGQVHKSKTVPELEKAALSFMGSGSSGSGSSDIESSTKVAVINFIGPVVKYADWWDDMMGTQDYIRILERLKNDPSIAGAVINTDTGGGQKYGTPEFYDAVKSFAAVKPIGIYTNGLLCSGGYYFAAAASFIMANKRADAIGSIGIYTEIFDWNGYYASIGLKVHTIYSDLSTEKNKSHRDVIDGKDADYKNYIKKELNPDGQKFIDDMKAARPQISEEVFKGGVWNGEESIAMGLVDSNGSLQDAIDQVFALVQDDNSNSNNNNNNSKKKTMSKKTKSFPVIQGIIGIEGEGIATVSTLSGKSGIQITEAQLETIENALVEKESAVTAANGKVTTAEGKVTALETAVNTALKTAGLDAKVDAEASIEDKITLLGAKVVEYGNKAGGKSTKPKAEGDSFEEDSIVDANAEHNKTYNNL